MINVKFRMIGANCSRMFKTDFLFRQQTIEFKPECQTRACYCATGCFVAFLGDF